MKEFLKIGETTYILLGTAHVFEKSVIEVREAIREEKPDIVALELDPIRLDALLHADDRKPTLREMKEFGFRNALLLLFMSYLQKKVSSETGIMAGREMVEAAIEARSLGIPIALIDRDLSVTIQKLMDNVGVKEKLMILKDVIIPSEEYSIDYAYENPKELIDQIKDRYPFIYQILVDERDRFMAENLKRIQKEKVLVIVGAGHVSGIKKYLGDLDV
ncbi:MAG: TraB family protein [Candidatus Methanofastidiosum methylothiophilum]|jgi:pheromone shutdown-related protein TraB|uniref:TraB family protein n=1 Tax=Candidatus Methanofastidiosum methylothiophilum TaxID=1705564 RepID=A0A150J3U2_9EURY|nr:MAG: TraB family protein [Candidatus Methanofastidiosum methylthiophilus]